MKGEGLTPQERIDRARRASALLEDPVLAEAIEAAEAESIARWLDTDRPDPDRALSAWATHKALALIREDLRRTLADGQIAAEAGRRKRP